MITGVWHLAAPSPRALLVLGTLGSEAELGARMDIIIMIVLMATAICAWRGLPRSVVMTLWVIGLVLMMGLFKYHVTSPLHLNF